MRIGLVIADFEMSFTTSFIHTAARKYNSEFTNSSVRETRDKLNQLKENILAGNVDPVYVAYDFTLADVEHIQKLFENIVSTYIEALGLTAPPDNKKIYHIMEQLREANTPQPTQIAQEVIKEIVTPQQSPNQTRKRRIEQAAEAKSYERALNMIRKNNGKHHK